MNKRRVKNTHTHWHKLTSPNCTHWSDLAQAHNRCRKKVTCRAGHTMPASVVRPRRCDWQRVGVWGSEEPALEGHRASRSAPLFFPPRGRLPREKLASRSERTRNRAEGRLESDPRARSRAATRYSLISGANARAPTHTLPAHIICKCSPARVGEWKTGARALAISRSRGTRLLLLASAGLEPARDVYYSFFLLETQSRGAAWRAWEPRSQAGWQKMRELDKAKKPTARPKFHAGARKRPLTAREQRARPAALLRKYVGIKRPVPAAR